MEPNVAPVAPQPQPQPQPAPVAQPSPPSHGGMGKVLLGLLVVVIAAASAFGGYVYGRGNKPAPVVTTHTETVAPITVPKDATLTADCEAGRGKQYILPKDIPMGPIYDVNNNEVVAIEYVVSLSELKAMPDKFMDLSLSKQRFDHLEIMAVEPHAGVTEEHFHVMAALMPHQELDAITCGQSSGSMTPAPAHMH